MQPFIFTVSLMNHISQTSVLLLRFLLIRDNRMDNSTYRYNAKYLQFDWLKQRAYF